ncbi:sigma-70 family RNA polymerase sigma factor [Niallia taxi]|uniref:sigma-70 family RNA polymerase sigma factor n=1 Tax=Niallia taxi TaxID=2499688 RepID=UPI0039824F7D
MGYREKEYLVTPSEKQVIDKAMAFLSKRELEVFLMYKGRSMSQYEIARILNISRNSVKSLLTRANKKVATIIREVKVSAV